MPDERGELREINYRQLLPWTELFRSFHIALDPRKLLLAAAAILVMSLAWWMLAIVFGNPEKPADESAYLERWTEYQKANDTEELAKEKASSAYRKDRAQWELRSRETERYKRWPWQEDRGRNAFLVVRDSPEDLLSYEFWRRQAPVLWEPLQKVVHPINLLFHEDRSWSTTAFALLGLLFTLATWALFGGAITRIAAVQIARKETISMVEALKFSVSKWVSFFSAPLIPFIGVAVVSFFLLLGGLLLHVNWLGDLVASLAWPLALLGGFIMALILIGFLGWPMMYATISAEGSDSFDALSRSYSYVYQRPWHYLSYGIVALIYGLIVIFFAVFVTSLFVYLSKWGVSLAGLDLRDYRLTKLFVYAPTSYEWQRLLLTPESAEKLQQPDRMDWAQYAGAGIMGFWLCALFLAMLGFAYSYFWSAGTIIYFLLRRSVDDTDLDEVYLEEEEEEAYRMPPPSPAPGPTTLPMVEQPSAAEPPKKTMVPPESAGAEQSEAPSGGDGNPPPG